MDRTTARDTIRRDWRHIMPAITKPAMQKVNGEQSYICPLCGHGTHGDGLTMNPQSKDGNSLKCFSCGFSGDVIDLYQQTTGKDHSTALEDLAQIAGVKMDLPPYRQTAAQDFAETDGLTARNGPQRNSGRSDHAEIPQTAETQQRAGKRPTEGTADYTAYYEECRERLFDQQDSAGLEYLKRRGVDCTAIFYGAGYDPQADPANAPGAMGEAYRPHPCPRVIFPCSPSYYVARSIDPETPDRYKKMNPARSKGASAPAIFNVAALYAQEVQEVFLTEGIFDALSVIEVAGEGRAIALNSTSNARAFIEMLERKPTAATIILCLDNDGPGKRAAQEVQEGLARLKVPFISADITDGHKDPNEALVADREAFYSAVQDAISEAQADRKRRQEEAQRAEQERQQRTGAGMVDAFLETVRTEKYKPIPTGITDIDKALYGGFTRQTLVLLGAAPGAGKTALTQWIFEGMAKRGTACLFINLEMSGEQMLARSLARTAAQNGDKITPAEIMQGYRWTAAEEIIVRSAAEEYKRTIAPRMIYNPEGVTADLDCILQYAEAEAERAEAAGMPAPLVVIDYLQLITGKDREDAVSVIKRAVFALKNFAIRHNTVVFCIMANNRPANQSGTVTQESGRDTSALEYGSDILLGLSYTKCLKRGGGKDKKDLTPEELRYLTLQILKGRSAKIGAEVDLFFSGESMTYTQIATEFQEEEAPHPRGRTLKK